MTPPIPIRKREIQRVLDLLAENGLRPSHMILRDGECEIILSGGEKERGPEKMADVQWEK